MVIKLKRKLYADSDKKEGMGTGTKVALGAGTLALGFAGARRGLLGNAAMRGTNKFWAKAGNALGSESMIRSGAHKYGVAITSGAKSSGKSVIAAGREGVKAKEELLKQYGLELKGKAKEAAKEVNKAANTATQPTVPTPTNSSTSIDIDMPQGSIFG